MLLLVAFHREGLWSWGYQVSIVPGIVAACHGVVLYMNVELCLRDMNSFRVNPKFICKVLALTYILFLCVGSYSFYVVLAGVGE